MLLFRRLLASVVPPVLGLACGQPAESPQAPNRPATSDSTQPTERSFASVPPGTVGPYLSLRPDSAVALWAQTDAEASGWYTRALGLDGAARGRPRRVAKLVGAPGLVRFRPFGHGYVAVASGSDDDGGGIVSLVIDEDGGAIASPTRVGDVAGRPLWLDVVDVGAGGLVFWAERSGSSAKLFVVAIDERGGRASQPLGLHSAARAWQVVASGERAVAALVNEDRRIELCELTSDGRIQKRSEIPNAERVNSELDLVVAGDRLILAFTATPLLDAQLFVAVLELDGSLVTVPRPAVPPLGEQTLYKLLSGAGHTYLAWQDTVQAPELLKVAELDGDGSSKGSPLWLPWNGVTPAPELAVEDGELRALVWACVTGVDCREPLLPALIAADPLLRPRSVDPWVVDGRAPDLSWDLSCVDRACLGLAAAFSTPVRVYAMGADPLEGEWVTPAFPQPEEASRVSSLEAVLETLELSAFDGIRSTDQGTLIAWLSDFDPAVPYTIPDTPAPDGRRAPVRAQLHTQWIPDRFGVDAPNQQLDADTVISYRARSLGGVSVSAGEKNHLLVWAAIDGKTPQVFTTLIDGRGAKVAQQMLTRQQGEVTNITSLRSGSDWIVGWIDDRNGKPRPQVTRLSPTLARRVPDVAVGSNASNTSGIAMRDHGDEVWHVRSETSAGRSSLTLARLDARNLKTRSEDVLESGGANRHSPSFAKGAVRPILIWIRDEKSGASLEIASLGDDGKLPTPPLRWKTSHSPVAASARCDAGRCRVITTTQSREAQFLEVLEFTESSLQRTSSVATILSTQALLVPPLLLGEEAWFYDLSQRDRPRLYRARLNL